MDDNIDLDNLLAQGMGAADLATDEDDLARALGLDLRDTDISADDLQGGQSALPHPPTPPAMVPDNAQMDWGDLQLVIAQHSVHKVEYDETTGDKCYIVSNLRKFKIEVALVDKHDQQQVVTTNQLQLRAVLLYENGCPVKATSEAEPLLLGETEVVVIQGCAAFRLQMGPSVLSSKLGKQSFRIRIEPMDRGLRDNYASQLVILTEPLKSVTKLERRPPPPSGPSGFGGVLHNGPAIVTQPHPPAPPTANIPLAPGGRWGEGTTAPPVTSRQVSPPPLPGQRFANPGESLFPPSPPRDEPAARSEPPRNGGAAAGGGAAGLSQELDSQTAQRLAIEEVVRQQRAQIAELTNSNAKILAEMSRLRGMLAPNGKEGGRHVAARGSDDF